MSVNIEGNISRAGAASGWYQNSRLASPQEKEKDAPQPKADNAVKVSISQEGIENYRKQTREKGISGRVVVKGNKESVIRQAKQAASALSANAYGGELAGEMEKLQGQRVGGTRERYVEDENSETGFRKMTMEEEVSELDRAFQKMTDKADTREMIEGEFKRLRTEGGKGLNSKWKINLTAAQSVSLN